MKRENKTFNSNGQSGAVIIAVLAAMVFIGIVTASILKNTGSQSAASRGYSSLHSMNITVKSGIIATESYFSNPINADTALKILTKALNDKEYKPYIFCGDGENHKIKLADYQFFSSRLINFNRDGFAAVFEINSGRSARGKNIKKAHAFYRMGNIKIESGGAYGGKNAIYLKGSLVNGDNGMEVYGDATFEGNTKFQNSPSIFHGDAYFHENAEFMANSKFYGKTYVGGNATFQNLPNSGSLVFENDVGFRGNLATGGSGTINTTGDVYIGGDFKTQYSIETNLNLKSAASPANNHFYYTDTLSCYNPPPNGQAAEPEHCVPNQWSCVKHPHGHADLSKVTGFKDKIKVPDLSDKTILRRLGMASIEERRDPQLDISKIDPSLIQSAYDAATNGSIFSVSKLHESYDNAAAEGRLYKNHLVLKIKRGEPTINFNEPHDHMFDKKVIFIVEDGAMLNSGGRFFHCSENSSTLIYAGSGNAALEQFGSSGPFRGLIYVDSQNTAQNSFNWKSGSSIDGAVHVFSDKNFTWNTGNSHNPPKISFNEDVLNGFGSLVQGAGSGGEEMVVFEDEGNPSVQPVMFGVYYF